MSEFFYDGQIRKYLLQVMRFFSNFSYKPPKEDPVQVPVVYGDSTRQVSHIIKENSENKILSTPRLAVYMTGLEPDRERTSDSTFVGKSHVRERAYDSDGKKYSNYQGKTYTVERLMPTPYKLSVNVDVWSSNTDQKLQLLEQILVLFNPSFEIQTNDNFLDWTSLTVLNLDSINFTSRSVPTGTESEIDIAQLTFSTPIYISPPAKIKRLGIVTNIIASVVSTDNDNLISLEEIGKDFLMLKLKYDSESNSITGDVDISKHYINPNCSIPFSGFPFSILVIGNKVYMIENGEISKNSWFQYLTLLPGKYQEGLSVIYLYRNNFLNFVGGRFSVNPVKNNELIVDFDVDTVPSNTIIPSLNRNQGQLSSIDFIIDPTRYDPALAKVAGLRLMLLGPIGSNNNFSGALHWKNLDNSDLVANANDIIEWSGTRWNIIFDSTNNTLVSTGEIVDRVFVTNAYTGKQYYWDKKEWLLSIDGEYNSSNWRIDLNN